MAAPAQHAAPTLTSIRDDLLAQQQQLQDTIDTAKTTQRETETRQRRIQVDLTAINRVITDQQAAATAADDAIAEADAIIGNIAPKIVATLDDQVEKQLGDAFKALIEEGIQAQDEVTYARGELEKANGEQAAAQQAVEAQEATVKQQRDAVAALPGSKSALVKDLKQQQAALDTAFKAGDVRKAYVLLREFAATRDTLDRLRRPEYEQHLVDAYVGSAGDLEERRGKLAASQAEAAKKKTALDDASTRLQAFQGGRAKRLQEIWSYQK
jgi:septal ring factor EnvC (AmiA/AmiB activator)